MSAADEVIKSVDSSMTSPEPSLRRQVMSYSQSLMLVRHKMELGWIGAAHSHPHEQLVYVSSPLRVWHIRFLPGTAFWLPAARSTRRAVNGLPRYLMFLRRIAPTTLEVNGGLR